MDNYKDFMAGVEAGQNGKPCPEDASEAFQRGHGMAKASRDIDPPIDLDRFEQHFQRVFG